MELDLQEEQCLLYKKTTKIGLRSVIYSLFFFYFLKEDIIADRV